jgi:hypothetical protein
MQIYVQESKKVNTLKMINLKSLSLIMNSEDLFQNSKFNF